MIVEYFTDQCLENGPPSSIRLTPDAVTAELKEAGFTRFEVNEELLECQYILMAKK